MKKILQLVLVLIFFSCKKNSEEKNEDKVSSKLGKEIFEGKGSCVACHKSDVKIIGPSLKEIVSVYDTNKADLASFLMGNSGPIVNPDQFEVMKTNLTITKNLSEVEMNSLVLYIKEQGK